MELAGISTGALASSVQSAQDTTNIAVLRKGMDIQEKTAQSMLDSIPEPVRPVPASKLPPQVGKHFNEVV